MMNTKKDEETGEALTKRNIETGEEEYILTTAPRRKTTFKIPPTYTKKSNDYKHNINLDLSPTFSTALLFLLPTTIFFYPILGIVTVMIEAIIHVWAHRKNKSLKNPHLYYQSPLHIICKEFCGACREEEAKVKISKIQEKRADKIKKYGLEYVRRIVT
ncbi:hypothetical protein TcasGA2_TC002531 [Tribolium castaneum]|uniref:Uncharacterized protein n=1 Tax=Tribolium castaneum TaxID=7070 RepID=D6WGV1_TRICA|nr:PREDICTED: uncharacterized protein LOC656005 [Tribolium castaneum]EEZ99759.1 hypothetical protein TcasGA2_TC002531 [Tribolium castaneum]|eukprot:XP_976161.1 PREDICTED: uncharacterized protein LOC656005 [Tribolium castaneum]